MLSNKKNTHKRQVMSLLDVVGNVGGFNDALWLLINFFMASYSSLMFMRSVTQNTPIDLTSKKDTEHERKQARGVGTLHETLSRTDMLKIASALKNIALLRVSKCLTLKLSFCC